ncbi:MAG: DNA-binding response regulator [SAR86 cluster bacterium]|uniref:DNA-binding response regulator n=1 Tax=SAR86 cluster bacterium TaxID=2030880 RepID=A0A2A5CDD1_9GAMM|nr:response regulator transcription factor [Gammaproteobacteria bacterium AH-315-E17]PCJ41772.1 MAG: DNA-binding response regulator [SAR86 cluster bacterium]
MNRKKIVIIEDEPDILEVLSYNLKREGFIVLTAFDGDAGLSLVKKEKPDLVLLDLMLPGTDGIKICSSIKNDSDLHNTLVIMVTAKGEESDVVLGLGVGADDYVSKPFSPKELVARVKAVLRRGTLLELSPEKEKVEYGDLIIDVAKHKILVKGEEIKLTATEFKILHYLASSSGRVFSREQLLNKALGDATIVVDRNIDVHIRGIRKKLGIQPSVIETIRGVGYRFKE